MNYWLTNFANHNSDGGLWLFVWAVFSFFWWLERKNPKTAKKAAIAFASIVWLLLGLLLILLYFTDNL